MAYVLCWSCFLCLYTSATARVLRGLAEQGCRFAIRCGCGRRDAGAAPGGSGSRWPRLASRRRRCQGPPARRRNPFHHGQAGAIPYIVSHDGRTVKYPDPVVSRNDSVKFDITTGKIVDCFKFEAGNTAMITRGANAGRVGVIGHLEKHPGSFDIVHLKDKRGKEFATRSDNVFVIGEGAKAAISLPRGKGIKLTIVEDRDKAESKSGKKKD